MPVKRGTSRQHRITTQRRMSEKWTRGKPCADTAQDSDTYSEEEIEEEQWAEADEDDSVGDKEHHATISDLRAVGAVTVSPPSPAFLQHNHSRAPSAFDRKRPSPVSTHFLKPEQPPVTSASSLSSQPVSSAGSTSATSAIDEPAPSQRSASPFTIAPSAPASPAVPVSDNKRGADNSARQQPQEDGGESMFEL